MAKVKNEKGFWSKDEKKAWHVMEDNLIRWSHLHGPWIRKIFIDACEEWDRDMLENTYHLMQALNNTGLDMDESYENFWQYHDKEVEIAHMM